MSNVAGSMRAGGVSDDARAMMLFEANKKSPFVAYVLLLLLGLLGGHKLPPQAHRSRGRSDHPDCDAGVILAGVRRLHDRDKSGHWLLLFYLVPALVAGFNQALKPRQPFTREMMALVGVLILAEVGISVWGFVELGCLRGTGGPEPLRP